MIFAGRVSILPLDFIQALGYAFAHLYQAAEYRDTNNQSIVVIGYDVRCSSDDIAHTLATILAQHGLHVIQLGLVTTPMMAYWAAQYQGHGIMVTASHSAKDILGIKWLVNNQSPSCAEIQALYQQLAPPDTQLALTAAIGSLGHLPTEQVSHGYIDAIYHVFSQLYPSIPYKW